MEPAPELCALLERYYLASSESDADFLERYVSHDPDALVIGTDPREWWAGGEEVIGTWGAAWRRRGGMKVAGSRPVAFREGSVGWLADQAAFQLPNGHELPF